MKEVEQGNSPLGVVLFQLGGPDSLEAVEPFLYNLFSDPDIIDFPFARLARPVMARLISSRRAEKVREHYARIGGKSPLRELTERQAAALERELRKDLDARVVVAMRYWHPLTDEALHQITELNLRRLVLLPLYPQYSKTTTGSSLNEWKRQFERSGRNHTETHVIRDFYAQLDYLDAIVEKINEGLERFERDENRNSKLEIRTSKSETRESETENPKSQIQNPKLEDVHLIFSAHGVPCSVIEAGDPYQLQIEETVRLVMAHGGWANSHHLCYQSRVGPGRWLGPTLEETIRRLASDADSRFRGNDIETGPRMLVVPISFVSDHVETLAEIDLEARALAGSLGARQFELMPALNDSPRFIQALRDLVLARIAHSNHRIDLGRRSE